MNDNEKSHDLYDFMYQISNDIASKYSELILKGIPFIIL